jgi:hypothetical protein
MGGRRNRIKWGWAYAMGSHFVGRPVRMSVSKSMARVRVVETRLGPALLEIHLPLPDTDRHPSGREIDGC